MASVSSGPLTTLLFLMPRLAQALREGKACAARGDLISAMSKYTSAQDIVDTFGGWPQLCGIAAAPTCLCVHSLRRDGVVSLAAQEQHSTKNGGSV